MKFLRLLLLTVPFLMLNSAYAVSEYKFPNDDINTQTGTFPVTEEEVQMQDDVKPLEMQKEEAETEVDSFGQDKFNENVDPDKLDTTKDTF